jgi:hypothetical protein
VRVARWPAGITGILPDCLKRLGAILWLAHERQPSDFEELLLLEGVGPRTLQSLALVSEVIHGTPIGQSDRLEAVRRLSVMAQRAEKDFTSSGGLEEWIEKEREDSWKYQGRTVYGREKPPTEQQKGRQLRLF